MPQSFTFTNYDVQNSDIVPTPESPEALPTGNIGFRMSTERSRLDSPKRTVLYRGTSTQAAAEELPGRIDWKEKRVEVAGVSKPFNQVRQKTGGTFSLTTVWQWDENGKKYEVKFKKGDYMAREVGQTDFIATYTSLKRHAFGKYDLPTLTFHNDGFSEKEKAVLIFAMLFSDIELPAKQKPMTFKAAMGGATANAAETVAGNVASYAVGNCCSIQ